MVRTMAFHSAPTVRETTGERIKRLRKARGWSQAQLAEAAGLEQQAISHAERDRHEPRISTIEAIADALDETIGGVWRGRP